MKAYNSKKTPREHILFCYKQRKLSLSQSKEYETSDGKKEKYVDTGIFKITGRKDKVVIHGDYFKMRSCFEVINRIVMKTNSLLSVTNSIKRFEGAHNLKISDLGLERKDFFAKNFDMNEVVKKLRAYKEGKNETNNNN